MIQAMTYDEFKSPPEQAGLSKRRFAEAAKRNPSSITNRPAHGEIPLNILQLSASLMSHMADHGMDYRVAWSQAHFETGKPRSSAVKDTPEDGNRKKYL